MKQQEDRILKLIERLEAGIATPDEISELSDWYESATRQPWLIPANRLEQIKRRMFEELQENTGMIAKPDKSGVRRRMLRFGSAAAAVVAGIFVLTVLTGIPEGSGDNGKLTEISDLMPGDNKAVFIAGNQQRVDLDGLPEGSTLHIDNASIRKTEDGQVLYEWNAHQVSSVTAPDRPIRMNTISTPLGGHYQVKLPDGSTVWLNAGSTITFPENFGSPTREVALSGEAFFDVAHLEAGGQQVPFVVQTNGYDVKVYGTSFNVSAYEDDQLMTTLVSGSVGITLNHAGAGAGNEYFLRPGQQAVLIEENLAIGEADLNAVTAWKEGFFYYRNTDLETLLKQVARWYDAEIAYGDNISDNLRFNGKIPRNYTLNEFMTVLALSRTDYRIERVEGTSGSVNKLTLTKIVTND